MHRIVAKAALAVLCLCAGAFAQAKKQAPAAKTALDKPTMAAYVRHTFMLPANFQVLVDDPKASEVAGLFAVSVTVTDGGPVRQQVEFFVSLDGTKIIQAKVYDVRKSPFASDLTLLKTQGAPSMGPDNAPVQLIVFSDFQCPHCKDEALMLRSNLEKNYGAQVRLVFKEYPLEQIHPWAKSAAMIGRCIQKLNPGAFWDYHDWIFGQQAQMTAENLKAKSLEFANTKNLDGLQMTQCIDGNVTAKAVEASAEEARALQITSTPTLFVNGRRLMGNVPWETLKAVIDYELDYSKKAQAAKKEEEACCELKLPIPVK